MYCEDFYISHAGIVRTSRGTMPVKERPILFNTEMVKAILDGRKTMTRRVIKPQPHEGCGHIRVEYFYPTKIDRHGEEYPGAKIFGAYSDDGEWGCKCPYGQAGDRLYIKKNYLTRKIDALAWLEITGIRAERLQDISIKDCLAEGVEYMPNGKPREQLLSASHIVFADYWDSINAARGYSWESNPWVWPISYKAVLHGQR